MSAPAEAKSAGSNAWVETLKTFTYALVIALGVRTLLYQPFSIPSGSMKSTLLVGDYLFASKFSYGYSRYSLPFGLIPFKGRLFGAEPKRGDVVIFKLPRDNATDYIKRVIGLPGDEISRARSNSMHPQCRVARSIRVSTFGKMRVTTASIPRAVGCRSSDSLSRASSTNASSKAG